MKSRAIHILISLTISAASGLLWAPETLGGSSHQAQKDIVVAVIDTGADVTHPELKDHLWLSKENSHGFDFTNTSADLTDKNGHGTHIAGLIKEEFLKVRRTDVSLRLMILKYTDTDGRDSKEAFLKAIQYAIDNNANVINISASGKGFSKKEYDLLKKAEEKGIQIAAATGNKLPGTKDVRTFPASYSLSNIHAVAAVNDQGVVLPSCNLIKRERLLFARGEHLRSTLPGHGYGLKTGTSQATAIISGRLAAYLANRTASFDYAQNL